MHLFFAPHPPPHCNNISTQETLSAKQKQAQSIKAIITQCVQGDVESIKATITQCVQGDVESIKAWSKRALASANNTKQMTPLSTKIWWRVSCSSVMKSIITFSGRVGWAEFKSCDVVYAATRVTNERSWALTTRLAKMENEDFSHFTILHSNWRIFTVRVPYIFASYIPYCPRNPHTN